MSLVDLLTATDAVKFGEFELSHGGTSDYYVDKYVFETDPECLDAIAEAFAARVDDETLARARDALKTIEDVSEEVRKESVEDEMENRADVGESGPAPLGGKTGERSRIEERSHAAVRQSDAGTALAHGYRVVAWERGCLACVRQAQEDGTCKYSERTAPIIDVHVVSPR